MKLPPFIITIKIRDGKSRFGLWLPVVILWPFLVVAAMILVPIALVAQLVLVPWGVRPLSVLAALYEIIVSTRGTSVDVQSGKQNEKSIVKIKIV